MTELKTDINFNMFVARGINELKHAVHECAVAHGWWDIDGGDRNMGEMIALMHSELSEALESYRDSEPYLWYDSDHRTSEDGKPCGIASEFADVIIRILDTCEKLDIPITQALIEKHNYNLTRPYRHGGKLC